MSPMKYRKSDIRVPSLRAQFLVREFDAAHVVDVPARELCRAVGMDVRTLDDPSALVLLSQLSGLGTCGDAEG
jgi:hypothetical protein